MDKWRCKRCNYVVVGKSVPSSCPNCKGNAGFELIFELLPFTNFYDE